MQDYFKVKINFTGGIVSPGVLQNILIFAHGAGIRKVRFGLRQQLIMNVFGEEMKDLTHHLTAKNIDFEVNTDTYPNIVSSYAAEEIFSNFNWLTEGIYKDIFDLFDYHPRLKINISDNNQSFTPFFTGNLNFIASSSTNYWYLYLRFPKTNQIFLWKDLIYTNEIPRLSQKIEEKIYELPELFYGNDKANGDELYKSIMASNKFISRLADEELLLPPFQLPYYEGFNKYGNKTWLGIYRRDEQFDVRFLNDLCNLCLKTKVGQICITNWKSLIIKDIDTKDREKWSRLLGYYQLNIRHAANELNWQIEDDNEQALALKQYIVKELDKSDSRTFGMSFAIQTRPKSELFGSVVLRQKPLISLFGMPLWFKYDILYTENFNPNSRSYIVFEKNLLKMHLPEQIRRLCHTFYRFTTKETLPEKESITTYEESQDSKPEHIVHQCKHCLTVYDIQFGDAINQIEPGFAFEDLPETYHCPTCEAPKTDFHAIKAEIVYL
jgi:rubredoxin